MILRKGADLYQNFGKGLASNKDCPTKPEISSRSDDFTVIATPLWYLIIYLIIIRVSKPRSQMIWHYSLPKDASHFATSSFTIGATSLPSNSIAFITST